MHALILSPLQRTFQTRRDAYSDSQKQSPLDRFDELKLRYQSVLNLIPWQGVELATEDNKNAIWNQIKPVDPSMGDILCEPGIDSSLVTAPKVRTYTAQAGDSPWQIATDNLGTGTLCPKIVAANPDRLKDEEIRDPPGRRPELA
ncbi:MAG TPA: hypothetical protein VGK29_19920 [Paludibaculum sp.]